MTKSEILKTAKPILFNTEMVRAILAGRKTQTRRIAKPQDFFKSDNGYYFDVIDQVLRNRTNTAWCADKNGKLAFVPPITTGNILYVRETWNNMCGDCGDCTNQGYNYKADLMQPCCPYEIKWLPSIHMPKEAARIFLRVTDVSVERLQDISRDECLAEGTNNDVCRFNPHGEYCNCIDKYSALWDSTIKKSDLTEYGWAGNPWVWVYRFERVTVDAKADTL
jgi:hypothetical protein